MKYEQHKIEFYQTESMVPIVLLDTHALLIMMIKSFLIMHATVFKRMQEDVIWPGDALKVELAHFPPGALCYDS